MLRPGAHVLRRDAHHLQVGTCPGTVLPDRPGLHQLLLALDGLHEPDWLAAHVPEMAENLLAVLKELAAAGVVLDAQHGDTRRPEESRQLALIGQDPRAAAARRQLRVSVHGDPGTAALVDTVQQILHEAGIGTRSGDDADLLIIVSTGEPARELFAEAVRHRIAHLPVRIDEAVIRIGPFVVPGTTACLGCHDLHRIDWDSAWAALLPQFGRRGAQHNPPAPGAVLRHAAAAEIAAGIVDLADHSRSFDAGTVVTLGPPLGARHTMQAGFHHRCPCALLPPA